MWTCFTRITFRTSVQARSHLFASQMGICNGAQLPTYIQSKEHLWNEVLFAVAATFADFNMANYPPLPSGDLYRGCQAFQTNNTNAYQKMRAMWRVLKGGKYYIMKKGETKESDLDNCHDLNDQIPAGPNATVYCSDWSGCGSGGFDSLSWDFQLCTELVVEQGYGPRSMFPERVWTLEALESYCKARFGVHPSPTRLVDKWHFNDLVGQGASPIGLLRFVSFPL